MAVRRPHAHVDGGHHQGRRVQRLKRVHAVAQSRPVDSSGLSSCARFCLTAASVVIRRNEGDRVGAEYFFIESYFKTRFAQSDPLRLVPLVEPESSKAHAQLRTQPSASRTPKARPLSNEFALAVYVKSLAHDVAELEHLVCHSFGINFLRAEHAHSLFFFLGQVVPILVSHVGTGLGTAVKTCQMLLRNVPVQLASLFARREENALFLASLAELLLPSLHRKSVRKARFVPSCPSLATLAEAVSFAMEPVADLRPSNCRRKLAKVVGAAIHGFNVASNLGKLVSELVSTDFDATSVSARNRDSRLKVGLLVNTFHHGPRFHQEVRALQF